MRVVRSRARTKAAVIEIKTRSVQEFMRAILPTEPHFAGRPTLFRGQADANWGLVPSLWRASA
jgi:hypothetical protein